MTALLVTRLGREEIARTRITKHVTLIGRSPEAQLVLAHDDVSRRHAVITWDDDDYTLSDPGSLNGIALNGKLLDFPRLLKRGDELTIGPYTLTFFPEEPSGET